MEKLENAGKQFDSETMTRYNASRDYIALYLAREQQQEELKNEN